MNAFLNTLRPPVLARSLSNPFVPFLISLAIILLFSPTHSSAQERSPIGDYQVSGPYHYKNLSVFLVHGKESLSGRKIVTLEEGLAQGIVKVYETGSVNQLEIENISNDTEVYIQAGDIVKGGRQDRTLGIDLTLAPNSGKVPIASFCVEHGRWRQRGEESAAEFNSSNAMVTSNSLRLAIKGEKNQSEVWNQVSVMQTKLSHNVGVQVNAIGTHPVAVVPDGMVDGGSFEIVSEDILASDITSDIAIEEVTNRVVVNEGSTSIDVLDGSALIGDFADSNVDSRIISNETITSDEILDGNYQQYQSAALPAHRIIARQNAVSFNNVRVDANNGNSAGYTTSLQLSLENKELIDNVEEYMAALQTIIEEHNDVIGFAFTINGEMKNADLYGSGDLFRRLWPKLLRAAATEAVSERKEGENGSATSIDVVRQCFLDAESATPKKEEVSNRMIMVTRKSSDNVLFETQEKGEDNWLHRNYMKLE